MKKIIVSVLLLTNIYGASAQSLETGIKMVQYERYENAKKELSSINSALANFYTGLALIGQDKVDDAKNIFNKYPTDYVNQTGLVRVLFEQKNIETANTLIKSIIDKNKKNLPILRFVADAITYTNGGDYNQAVDIYKKIIEKADNADIRIALGDAYRKQIGGGGEAMNNYEKAVELDSKNSLAYSRIGSLWYEAHNYNDALSNYTKAKDNDANNPLPYRDLANAYYWIGKYDLAKQNIERYIELSDQSLDDKKKYADILYLTKNYN
jgi:tetratricopeptide (TPR) repeat protein